MTAPCAIKLDHGVIGNGSVLTLVAPSTHIAVTISELIEARDSRFRAWS